ncbi:uncharacterized protein E5676_scaffold3607G00170 [Cucumis melo var. makuwa]|uniref:Uncharacterized protein n=1 Tax=Cucumis melo var. makuwa TaxID=1194695 RepID=A0A5D3E0T6_CUCMM|nr:uncharacterized protein E5676_scaffold3607G00170 [Cucumis melo var. makuwa]
MKSSLKVKRHDVILTNPKKEDSKQREDEISCHYITILEELEIEIPEEDTEDVPQSLEDGGQSTVDELKEVNLGTIKEPHPTFISASLSSEEEGKYMSLLTEYKDIFAWSYKEMPGLDPKVVVHHLAIKPGYRLIKQAQQRFRPELIPQIEVEVNKLIEVGFIREVKYPTWIANIVLVRKKNGQLRVCVDFRDLNNACPKDDFSLPITEIMVDATTGHEALSFMDGSSGYNQIRMVLSDEEMIAFRTLKEIYCYKVMPFGLKSAGATYQRAMQKVFDDMLHKYVKCYIDDLVLRMNPLKCAFGVTSGKFLGFIVRHQGIEIDQSKIDVIQKMPMPKSLHDLRSLQGRLAYIRRFISNMARAPIPGKPLILYIAAQERSLGLHDSSVAKANPIKYVLSRPISSGRLAKWAVLLQQYDIVYIYQKAIKGQALADFLADHPIPSDWKLCIILISPEKYMLPYSFALAELCSNNVAEYQALIIGLQMALEIEVSLIEIYGDSKLIINQLLLQKNKRVDALANLAIALMMPDNVALNIPLCKRWIMPLIFPDCQVANVMTSHLIDEEDWRQPTIEYLEHGKLPKDSRHKAEEESIKALNEAHVEPLHPTVASWPFEAWGLDLVGPITLKSSAGHSYILATTDYFSKWVEAIPLREAKKENVRTSFVPILSIDMSKRDWQERIDEALWAYRTTHCTPTEVTPYSLVYGVEAVLPLEREIPSLRMTVQEGLTTEDNVKLRLQELEALDEK